MSLVRYLQHWLSGTGARLQVTDFVPDTHPLRQWADTFPWAALVAAIEQSFAQRFPRRSCPPQKCGLRSPSSFCETVTIVQTAQIENSPAEMIRYYLSLIPEPFKFVWAHVNIAENTPQRSNFERTVAMNWN